MRTLEERIKFDHGLRTRQDHLVVFTLKGHERRALVNISAHGNVRALAQPREGDMYCAWDRLIGDTLRTCGGVKVHPARDPEFMAQFEGPVAAVIPVQLES